MKHTMLNATVPLIALLASLVACGGGGDAEAGSPTAFSVIPTSTTFTAPVGTPAGACLGGGSTEVFVYGGVAPYRIDNTVPRYVSVNVAQVDNRGGSFVVTALGTCLTTGSIVVVDKLDHIVSFTVSNVAVGTTTGP